MGLIFVHCRPQCIRIRVKGKAQSNRRQGRLVTLCKGRPKLKWGACLTQLLDKSYRVRSLQYAAWADAIVFCDWFQDVKIYSCLKSLKDCFPVCNMKHMWSFGQGVQCNITVFTGGVCVLIRTGGRYLTQGQVCVHVYFSVCVLVCAVIQERLHYRKHRMKKHFTLNHIYKGTYKGLSKLRVK